MRQSCRKDANHGPIKQIFLEYGFDAIDTAGYSGKMLDLLVTLGHHFFSFIEIKDGSKPPSQRKLTTDEKDFIAKRPDHCTVIETTEQARAFCAHVIAGTKF
jgi:hypothetical protein